jgi:hypothetical protein
MNQTADLFKYEQVGALKCSLHDSESYHVNANNYIAYLPLQKLGVSDVRECPSELDIMQQQQHYTDTYIHIAFPRNAIVAAPSIPCLHDRLCHPPFNLNRGYTVSARTPGEFFNTAS